MIDDATLLHRYAAHRSEGAFAELVRRHLPLVYSAAIRRLEGDAHRAADVAQSVFAKLARDADRLSRHTALTGWLYTATRNAAIDVVRSEQRRRIREQEAHTMQEISAPPETPIDWAKLQPVLDGVMDELEDDDREAVLLRYFQNRPFAEIACAIGLSEDAARKRVERAVEKLRSPLRQHGITSTSAALATVLASETALAAPATLASSIVGAAVANGSVTAGTAVLTSTAKLWIGIAAAAAIGGAVGVVSQRGTIAELRDAQAKTRQELAKLPETNAASLNARVAAEQELAPLRASSRARDAAAPASNQTVTPRPTDAAPRSATPLPIAQTPKTRQQRSDLHQRYDPFLLKYGLTPAQADRFVDLKIAIYEAQDDLQAAVRTAGAQGDSTAVEAMRSKLVKPMWDEIRQLLGPEGYRAYGSFETASAYRPAYIDPMLPEFYSANVPLSAQQVDQLLQLVTAHHRSVRVNPTDISTQGIVDWDGVVAQAGEVLTPAQLVVLQRYTTSRKSEQASH